MTQSDSSFSEKCDVEEGKQDELSAHLEPTVETLTVSAQTLYRLQVSSTATGIDELSIENQWNKLVDILGSEIPIKQMQQCFLSF